MRLYNTLTRTTEEFKPLAPPAVTMYVCGPTVYDDPHIGHARSAFIFDVLRRALTHRGYRVTFVRNVTDVDDKIIEKARQELAHSTQHTAHSDLKATCREVAEKYLKSYHAAMDRLGIKRPDVEPRATEWVIPQMTDFIAKLLMQGAAYEAEGDVYFAVRNVPAYGRLSNRTVDELKSGARVEPGERKRDPLDFALWKSAKPGEPLWKSPWGDGRPGWHIECSTMSTKELGDAFDIHGGGVDLIFPHHENEIAQAQAAGKPFARCWVHNGLLTVNGEKMSKSLGNFITVEQALNDCDNNADILKMFFLSGHYRSPLNYMNASVTASKQRYDNYRLLIDQADSLSRLLPSPRELRTPFPEVENFKQSFIRALEDDLNTPQALSILDAMRALGLQLCDEVQKRGRDQSDELKNWMEQLMSLVEGVKECGKVLGLFEQLKTTTLSNQINEWFEQYKAARGKKDFTTSDFLRKKLLDAGYIIQDTSGTSNIFSQQ